MFRSNLTWITDRIGQANPDARIVLFLHAELIPEDMLDCWKEVPKEIAISRDIAFEIASANPRIMVIDAAEWVGPVQDRRLGLHKAAKNYYSTGWHEPSTTTELLMSKKAFDALPKDVQGIVSAEFVASPVEKPAIATASSATRTRMSLLGIRPVPAAWRSCGSAAPNSADCQR